MDKKLELIAPAGNMEKLRTALAFGADAVYAGIPDFSLRVRINDFDLAKLAEAARYCHNLGKKIYVTANIFAHNRHIGALPGYVSELKRIGIDALIASDPGIIAVIKNEWPEARVHLSTQANCTNWMAAKFWHEQGISRVVLGRETTLEEIREIKERVPSLELEYFAHGAMCMAYSGRCFLSKYFLNRSANLGDCVQPCRWKFSHDAQRESHNAQRVTHNDTIVTHNSQLKAHDDEEKLWSRQSLPNGDSDAVVGESSLFISEDSRKGDEPLEVVEEEHGSYILNSKDLCLLPHLKELAEAGVTSFKIEGRAKSVYYQAMVAGIYSRATHNAQRITQEELDFLYNELETKLVHRGYTTGFLFGGRADQNLHESHVKSEWEFCGEVIEGNSGSGFVKLKVHNTLKVGDEVELVQPSYEVSNFRLEKLIDGKTGEEISEAHGGQDKYFLIGVDFPVGEWGVMRRKI